MRLLRSMLIPLLGIALGVLVLALMNPPAAMRAAQSQVDDLAQRAALAGATCIDEGVYAGRGAFTGMPLDEACARRAVTSLAPSARIAVSEGRITVTLHRPVMILGIAVPGMDVHGEASAHAEYLEGE